VSDFELLLVDKMVELGYSKELVSKLGMALPQLIHPKIAFAIAKARDR
jgi:hypothetical protein